MNKFTSIVLVFTMMAVLLTSTTSVFACDGNASFRQDNEISITAVTDSNTLTAMQTYLQTQYTNTSSLNAKLSVNLGYLFALKAIQLRGSSYTTMDCSKMVHNALTSAYSEKGLSSYYPFSYRKSSQQQYNDCVSFGLARNLTSSGISNLKTGDLVFWCDPDSGSINHVGIFFKYNSTNYVIESRSSAGGVVVSLMWQESGEYEYKAYARLNTAYTATFKTGSPFNESLGSQKVLFNCPPSAPTPPTHTNYVFTGWTPSVTAGITANTTYTANYYQRASKSVK